MKTPTTTKVSIKNTHDYISISVRLTDGSRLTGTYGRYGEKVTGSRPTNIDSQMFSQAMKGFMKNLIAERDVPDQNSLAAANIVADRAKSASTLQDIIKIFPTK